MFLGHAVTWPRRSGRAPREEAQGVGAFCMTCPPVLTGYSSRRVQSPSSKSNDTLSGISSIEPSKHSGSSHSLASVRSWGRALGGGDGQGTPHSPERWEKFQFIRSFAHPCM